MRRHGVCFFLLLICFFLVYLPLVTARLTGHSSEENDVRQPPPHRRRLYNNAVLLEDGTSIDNSYIVLLNSTTYYEGSGHSVKHKAQQLLQELETISRRRSAATKPQLAHVYEYAVQGLNLHGLTEEHLEWLQQDPEVSVVEHDFWVVPDQSLPWGLDRLDQSDLPLDGRYDSDCSRQGRGVSIYILDTGINVDHSEFEGRIDLDQSTSVTSEPWDIDLDGHGTHCAGIAAGSSVGVAPQANIVAVQVIGPGGSGLAGVEYVCNLTSSRQNMVMSLSFGSIDLAGRPTTSAALNQAVRTVRRKGALVVTSAGNNNINANQQSPANEPSIITVGATNINDERWTNPTLGTGSNYGELVDIFAPGTNIRSAGIANSNAYTILTGTSMAAPHVAGVLASIWSNNLDMDADEVEEQLFQQAVSGRISGLPRGSSSNNLLAQVCDSGGGEGNNDSTNNDNGNESNGASTISNNDNNAGDSTSSTTTSTTPDATPSTTNEEDDVSSTSTVLSANDGCQVEHCLECIDGDPTKCASCQPDYYLWWSGGTCHNICPTQTYFDAATNDCQDCPSICNECQDATHCVFTVCDDGYVWDFDQEECVEESP